MPTLIFGANDHPIIRSKGPSGPCGSEETSFTRARGHRDPSAVFRFAHSYPDVATPPVFLRKGRPQTGHLALYDEALGSYFMTSTVETRTTAAPQTANVFRCSPNIAIASRTPKMGTKYSDIEATVTGKYCKT